jgi:hypothetical protein
MKSNKTTVRQRVEEILSMRLLGAEFVDIRQHASAQGWNVGDRQLFRYIAKGDEILEQMLEKDRDKQLNRHIAQRRALLARAAAVSDYGTCARLLKDEGELLGLYPPKGINIGQGGAPMVIQIIEEIVSNADAKPPAENQAAPGAAGLPPQ